MQTLSVLDVRMQVRDTYMGYAHGRLDARSILDQPYISWGTAAQDVLTSTEGALVTLHRLLAHNLEHNPVLRQCLSLLERPSPSSGISVLDSSAVQRILQHARSRGGAVEEMAEDGVRQMLSTVTSPMPALHRTVRQLYAAPMMQMGNLVYRGSGDSAPLMVHPARVMASAEDISGQDLTLENTMFPFLFPFGRAAFNGAMKVSDYIRFRSRQLFSIFMMYKPYLPTMYQIKQGTVVLAAAREACMDKDLYAYKREHPGCTYVEAMAHISKHTIKSKVAGSPAWHRKQLQNLMTLVEHHGMPHLFLTLTADESSEIRWEPELSDMETLLRRFNSSFDWRDAPAAHAAMFHHRCTKFLEKHILCKGGGLLGDVEHICCRYEAQGYNKTAGNPAASKQVFWIRKRAGTL
jgi:hypothetical protein